jgi:hypothetical protein
MKKEAAKIKIEKNIPLPGRSLKKESIYPFEMMEVGDSFAIPFSKPNYSKLYQACRNFVKGNPGFKFTLRKNESENWIRIWRLKIKEARAKE